MTSVQARDRPRRRRSGRAPRRASADGVLELGGVDVRDLAAEFGTPALRPGRGRLPRPLPRAGRRVRRRRTSTTPARRSCAPPSRAGRREEGLSLDVCTGGELAVALRAGFPTERLLFHGNNKSVAELERAVAAASAASSSTAPSSSCGWRRSPSAPACGSASTSASRRASRRTRTSTSRPARRTRSSGSRWPAVRRPRRCAQVLSLPSLELVGLHCHIGSHIFDVHGFKLAAHRMVGLLAEVRDEHGVVLPELDLGGGQGIAYTAADDPMDVHEYADGLRPSSSASAPRSTCRVPRLAVEPGRAISGPDDRHAVRGGHGQGAAGAAHLRQRRRRHERQHPHRAVRRPLHRRARQPRRPPRSRATSRCAASTARAATSSCTTCRCPATSRPGDLVAVPAVRRLPPLDGQQLQPRRPPAGRRRARRAARVVVRRETEDDLLRLDVE